MEIKSLDRLRCIGFASLLVLSLSACEQRPGPAESAGKKIDQTADETGRKIGAAADQAGRKLNDEGTKAGIAIEDTEITAKVKAAIFAEPGLTTLQINVATEKGVVTLSGSIDSLPGSDRAKALAGAIAGVKAVINHLVLKQN